MAPQKPRCTFKECKSAAQRIVGDCGFCDGHFCAKHRLLEDHKCSGLEDVSMNPTPSMSRGGPDWPPSRWWLVGLADYLVEAGLDQEECCGGSSMLTPAPESSARRSRTSAMPHSSRPSGHKSSAAYKRRYARPAGPARSAHRHKHRRSRPGNRRPRRCCVPIFASSPEPRRFAT